MPEEKGSETDKALMELVAKGEWAAFETIVRRYTPSIHRFLYRFLGSRADAEDLVQETFLRAFQHANSFDPRYSLSTWLFTIARRMAINVSQSGYRRMNLPLESTLTKAGHKQEEGRYADIPETRSTPEDELYKKEKGEKLQEAIASLPDRQRTALLLSYFEGLSYKEIARVMRTSLSSVESIIYRAKQSLAKMLIND